MSFVYITEVGAKLQKRGGVLQVGRDLELLMELPIESVEGLVLVDGVQVSSSVMVELLRRGIPVTWLSTQGRFYGRLESTQHVDVFKQRRQILAYDEPFALEIARRMIVAKIHNQQTLVRRYKRNINGNTSELNAIVVKLGIMKDKAARAADRDQLMGYEGVAARDYFAALGAMVAEPFAFEGRSKRPPLDPFNSMLSLGYTLLMYELYTAICNQGLSPYFGVNHALKNHHPTLASDLMEEWRPIIIDSLAMSLASHHEVTLEHFYESEENGGVYMTREGRVIFLRAYEKKMRTQNKYLAGEHSYRRSIILQTRAFTAALMAGEASAYDPIMLR